MATATLTPPATAATASIHYRHSFAGVLKSEFTKLFSLRSTYWLFGMTFAGYVAMTALLAANTTLAGPIENGRDMAGLFQLAIYPAQLIAVAIGAIIVTGEYSTGAIHSSLTATPKRLPVQMAKSLVVALSVGAITVASMVVSVPLGKAFLSEHNLHIMTADFWISMAGGLVYLVGISLICVALGVLIRSTAGAVCAGLGIVLMLPVIFGQILANYSWATTINRFLPASLLDPLTISPLTSTGPDQHLTALAAAGVMVAWVVLLGAAAAFRLTKTDA